ncbi:MAG TPA: GDSL-type esterase/lipase family protein [Phycisphaerae bacterium]|nr:GDSL-type esterase/lipase family protein [Phycisphaerae bacterium]
MKTWQVAALFFVLAGALRAEFAIHDGDTVVFLGDSITAARGYGKIVENYTLLRYPDRRVRFINAGWGGDTAAGGAARLERDVLGHGATLVTVAYGVNDIGWGGKADDEHKQKYLDGIRDIVTQCRSRGVRVFICSAAITGADPDKSENDYLQRMCDEGMALSRSLGGGAIDVQRSMREIQKRIWAANHEAKDDKDKHTLHAADGIHLNDLGQLAMGFAILKGLGAPAEVSSVTIDAAAGRVAEASGCKVSELKVTTETVEFDRLDEGLPFNLGPLGALQFRFIPIPDQLNRYMLAVKGLSPGRYQLTVAGREVGTWPVERLAEGLNISSATPDGWVPGGPWDAQAATLIMLTDSRNQMVQAEKLSAMYLGGNPNLGDVWRKITDINERMESLQRTVAKPVPYRFVLKRLPPASRP